MMKPPSQMFAEQAEKIRDRIDVMQEGLPATLHPILMLSGTALALEISAKIHKENESQQTKGRKNVRKESTIH